MREESCCKKRCCWYGVLYVGVIGFVLFCYYEEGFSGCCKISFLVVKFGSVCFYDGKWWCLE